MPSTLTAAPAARASDLRSLASALWPTWLSLAAFAVLWLDLCHQLSYEWSTNDQYAYGWFVPILALGLFIKKWQTRPLTSDLRPPTSGPRFPLSPIPLFLALLYLPLRVIHEINQDWPLISWPLTLCAVGISLYAIYRAGGRPWVKHFAFPICFILVGVQWPYRIEHTLTQGLMRVVANITVELLGWINIPAMQHANLIELGTGTVGVDEACSGIRSFQSTLMGALFLGELYLLRWRARSLLVVAGLAIASLLNVCRTSLLSYQAATGGLSALSKWHDPAGFTIAVISFLCLWTVAALITKRSSDSSPSGRPLSSQVSSSSPARALSGFSFQPFSAPFSLSIAACISLTLAGNELWYRCHAVPPLQTPQWWADFPTNSPSYRPIPITASVLRLLKYDEEKAGSWEESDGSNWSAFLFRWKAGEPVSRLAARAHRPEICLSGSGHNLTTNVGLKYFQAKDLNLPFRVQVFDAPERPLYVFFCLWEDQAETQRGIRPASHADRLSSVLKGRRWLGQQTLEIICSGYEGVDQACAAVTARLPRLLTSNHAPSIARP